MTNNTPVTTDTDSNFQSSKFANNYLNSQQDNSGLERLTTDSKTPILPSLSDTITHCVRDPAHNFDQNIKNKIAKKLNEIRKTEKISLNKFVKNIKSTIAAIKIARARREVPVHYFPDVLTSLDQSILSELYSLTYQTDMNARDVILYLEEYVKDIESSPEYNKNDNFLNTNLIIIIIATLALMTYNYWNKIILGINIAMNWLGNLSIPAFMSINPLSISFLTSPLGIGIAAGLLVIIGISIGFGIYYNTRKNNDDGGPIAPDLSNNSTLSSEEYNNSKTDLSNEDKFNQLISLLKANEAAANTPITSGQGSSTASKNLGKEFQDVATSEENHAENNYNDTTGNPSLKDSDITLGGSPNDQIRSVSPKNISDQSNNSHMRQTPKRTNTNGSKSRIVRSDMQLICQQAGVTFKPIKKRKASKRSDGSVNPHSPLFTPNRDNKKQDSSNNRRSYLEVAKSSNPK
ncbi:MAG: hypothetical protein VX335_03090 [Pseudomonadota bacterium]|nr:hypothetical protein [Pseudomonadota bacterium]